MYFGEAGEPKTSSTARSHTGHPSLSGRSPLFTGRRQLLPVFPSELATVCVLPRCCRCSPVRFLHPRLRQAKSGETGTCGRKLRSDQPHSWIALVGGQSAVCTTCKWCLSRNSRHDARCLPQVSLLGKTAVGCRILMSLYSAIHYFPQVGKIHDRSLSRCMPAPRLHETLSSG